MCCNLPQVGRIAGELADGILAKLWHAAKSEMTQNLWWMVGCLSLAYAPSVKPIVAITR